MKKKTKKKHFSFTKVVIVILYITVFLIVSSPLIVLYGPYNNIRKIVVETILGTRHKSLITSVFSEKKINSILGESRNIVQNESQDLNEITPINKGTNDIVQNNIVQYNISTSKFNAYLLEIKDPLKVKVAMTKYLNKQGQRTSEMAKDNNAVAAINGGSFSDVSPDGKLYAGTGAIPGGFVISEGNVVYKDVNENTKRNVTAFTKNGTLIVGDQSINDLKKLNVKEAICFRPPTLIINGNGQITDKLQDGYNPRTAVGQKKDGTVLFLVIDGRTLTKIGASLYDVQKILLDHGAVNASNLDGGYSSTMYYNDEVINSPNEWDGERTVATAFYVEK